MSRETTDSRPNIILIEADQMSSFVLPFYSPKGQAIAPNLTRLAGEGVLFTNTYCNSPLCSPSRACMFTGAPIARNEVWGNGSEFSSDQPTMMHFLRHAGYRNVVSGKTHFIGADQLHGFDRRLTTDIYPSDFNWSIDWRPHVEHRPGTSVKKLEVSGLCRTNNQILYDSEVQFRAVEFLRYEALEPKDSPFFLHVSYTQPHESYQSVPKFWDLYDDVDIALPEQGADADEDMQPVTRWLRIHHGVDRFPPSDDTIRASRRAYYAMITQIDAHVGELMTELKDLGLAEDTIVIFCSDHGDMMGERNMWFKRSYYDKSSKVPLIVHNPKRFAAKVEDAIVSLADLCPTVADLGGAAAIAEEYGDDHSHSFEPLLEGDMPEWKDRAIVQYFGPGVEEPWVAIRRGDFKYVYTRNHPPLLFNMVEDPLETVNLADKKEHAALIIALHDLLFAGLDLDAVTEKAARSKHTRVFLHSVLDGSEGYHWDYQPVFDATRQYVRGPNKPATC